MNAPDYRQFCVLYVDDEERSLKSFERAFGDQFSILTANNAASAMNVLEQHGNEIAVLMTDQRMPGEKGVWLLDQVRQSRPNILRILVTAYSDLQAMIDAVNTGAIFHYVTKPWDPPQLESMLKHALQLYAVQRERDELLREKMAVLHQQMVSDRIVSLGFMAAGLSHHLRNWLVAVKTFIDLVPNTLRDEGVEPERARNAEFWTEYQKMAGTSLDKINDLLKELWAVAETPAVALTDRVDLQELFAECLAKLRGDMAAKQITFDAADLSSNLPSLTGDKAKISRMIELLLKDEIVSLPQGARISISAGVEGTHMRIVVSDNGPGLSKELLESIFDPFNARSDSPAEHGINLMACYFIAHYHGGKIEARSGANQGTEFIIRLPLSPERRQLVDNAELWQKLLRADDTWQKLIATR